MATTYQAPGVYVEETPSGSAPIAGVGTSTAGFLGIVPDRLEIAGQEATTTTVQANETGTGTRKTFNFAKVPESVEVSNIVVKVNDATVAPAEYELERNGAGIKAKFTDEVQDGAKVAIQFPSAAGFSPAPIDTPKLCTNFSEFKKFFGDFSSDVGQKQLAHAVYGFFNNGGTRCFVVRTDADADAKIDAALDALDAIDEIALVAAPGIVSTSGQKKVIEHCENMGDRFAILDGQNLDGQNATPTAAAIKNGAGESNYAAIYFPWIDVGDRGDNEEIVYYPPSGHIAGVYARVDAERGVHKAPANVVLRVALEYVRRSVVPTKGH